ncbi:MAG TPA: hypothetical protein VKB84_05035 [Candidatus Binataceae bacterium]|nr:hypothetical protein [Candidatus Binataceae bacterium]
MGRRVRRVDEAEVVALYRGGLSLRAVAATRGVSQTTVATWLKSAGEARRGTQEASQERWPRANITCSVCDTVFSKRSSAVARGVRISAAGDASP